ncbi:MAG: hypothetical protein M3467_03730, partial [Actinomycetota bacterium]|nr:hypothetical protein [Actinomycetota bacterium]
PPPPPPPRIGNQVERALQSRACDALAAMPFVDVDAGDPPVRTWRRVLGVLALVLDPREFLGTAVLAPDDECGVRATCRTRSSLTERWSIPFWPHSG